MSWHYQIRKHAMPHGEQYYDVVEVFTDPIGWTDDGIGASGETVEDVVAELRRMLDDVTTYQVLDEATVQPNIKNEKTENRC